MCIYICITWFYKEWCYLNSLLELPNYFLICNIEINDCIKNPYAAIYTLLRHPVHFNASIVTPASVLSKVKAIQITQTTKVHNKFRRYLVVI